MKRHILIFITILLACPVMSAAMEKAATLFAIMPDELLMSVEVNRRKDMIDLFHSGQKAQVENKLKGKATLTALTENFLSVDLSDNSNMQIKLFQAADSTNIIAVINTVCGPACDSRIDFYDQNWKALEQRHFIELPDINDFITLPEKSSDEQKYDAEVIDMILMQYSFDPENDTLSISFHPNEYMLDDMYKKVEPYLNDQPVQFSWDGKKFIRVKP